MKLQLIGQPLCGPCAQLKNEINDRIDELQAINVEFEYIDLNQLDDKETFIQKHQLSATPTALIVEGNHELGRVVGYMTVDILLEEIEGLGK